MLEQLPLSNWNYQTAAHLLNRAGFGGDPDEIQRLQQLGLEDAVEHLLLYEKIEDVTASPEWARPDPTRLQRFQQIRNAPPEKRKELFKQEQQKQRDHVLELRQWWLERMASGPRPLQEKMTLFWHGHFATSVLKVRDACLMWRQNETFRRYATGNWLEMLEAVSKDPAMLIWLDQAQSRKEHPNENYARELMELFTLGEGHYTEKDVTEGARALTGWSYDRLRQEFVDRPRMHDDGIKTYLGRTGRLTGDDVLRQILAQPQAARFLAGRIWGFFASDGPDGAPVEELAAVFRDADYQIKPMLRALFLSEAFYSPSIIGAQVKSPTQWLVGSVKLLQRDLPPALISSNALRLLGQDLFNPPNVKGWDGGLSWITTNNLLNRYNLAELLVLGVTSFAPGPMAMARFARLAPKSPRGAHGPPHWLEPADVRRFAPEEAWRDKPRLAESLEKRFLTTPLRPKQRQVLLEFLQTKERLEEVDVQHAIRLIMSTPEYQLA